MTQAERVTIKTCPGDCCRLVHLNPSIEETLDRLTDPRGRSGFDDAERVIELFWPNPEWSEYYECDAFDRVTRACTAYERRPNVCSKFPQYAEPVTVYMPCENCSFDGRFPDVPGARWPAIEETGIFCHDAQPDGLARQERATG